MTNIIFLLEKGDHLQYQIPDEEKETVIKEIKNFVDENATHLYIETDKKEHVFIPVHAVLNSQIIITDGVSKKEKINLSETKK